MKAPFLSPRGLAVVATLGSLASLCLGSSYAKTLFPQLGANGTTAMRLAFGAAVLVLLFRPWRSSLSRQAAGNIVLYGLVLGAMNLLFYQAIARIPLGLAIAVEFTGPLALAIASSRRPSDFLWVGLAVLGLGLLLPIHPGATSLDPVGIAYALAAAICWALYILAGQRLGNVPSGQAAALGMLVAAILAFPLGAAPAGAALGNPGLLLAGLAVGVLSSAIPYSLEMFALKRLPKHTFSILLSLEPALGALIALFMLGEALAPLEWGAIACVVAASAGSTLGMTQAPTTPRTESGAQA